MFLLFLGNISQFPQKNSFFLYAEILSPSLSLSLPRRKYHKGFTLVELMIVIAIIALLAVALLPKLTGAQAKARDTKKIAELRDLSAGIMSYFNDRGTYKIPNVGFQGGGDGFINVAINDSNRMLYQKNLSDALKEMGYLDKDYAFLAPANREKNFHWTVTPCNVDAFGPDLYLFYFSGDRYSLSAFLETAIDSSKIIGTFNWVYTCKVHARNYAIGN